MSAVASSRDSTQTYGLRRLRVRERARAGGNATRPTTRSSRGQHPPRQPQPTPRRPHHRRQRHGRPHYPHQQVERLHEIGVVARQPADDLAPLVSEDREHRVPLRRPLLL